ncbi:MAG: DUF3095 domain-containing protein [Betaproteobacteria bacterium]
MATSVASSVAISVASSDADYYAQLPVFHAFDNIMDPQRYQPLPDDWMIGLTDVVRSTQAIESGRYKAVNVAGASVIAALTNALKGRVFPYVFGGDGASFAVPPDAETAARDALAATAAWARDELQLELRTALVPVREVTQQGLTLSVARFGPSKNVSYAMFSGGGLAWAERAMRAGRFMVPAAPAGVRPDLSGLSCRWNDIPATRGVIVSLLVAPVKNGDPAFRALIEELLGELETSPDVAPPVPDGAPDVGWPPPGLELEARASRKPGEGMPMRRMRVAIESFIAYLVMRFNIRLGSFDPAVYRRDVVQNSDFRKYDDNLRMTLDCTPELADRIEARLSRAESDGIARFGIHRQTKAIMTCIVPSIAESNHVHFVDGAAGGYALAARRLKLL